MKFHSSGDACFVVENDLEIGCLLLRAETSRLDGATGRFSYVLNRMIRRA